MTDTYVGAIDTVALLIQIGDGGSPEVFTHPCLINTQRGFSIDAERTKVTIPDCTDPTKPGTPHATITGYDAKITGAGMLDQTAYKAYADWALGGQPKNVKVQAGSATGALIASGAFHCTHCEITGAKLGDMVEVSITLEAAGAITTTAHA